MSDRAHEPSGAPVRTERVTRTYLRMSSPEALAPGAAPIVQASAVTLTDCTVAEWRRLYRDIGGPWHWHDRDAWSDERLAAHLARDDVRVVRVDAVLADGPREAAGFFELERHTDGSVEIAYLGLDRRATGVGLGRWIVAEATRTAWSMHATHVWLHTCTLDGPAALPNYLARGFAVTRTEEYDATIPVARD